MSGILIVAEHRRGELRPVTLEIVGAAQAARRSADERVAVALLADEPQRLIPAVSVAGVDEIVMVQTPSGDFDPDVLEAAVRALIEARSPALVLVPHSIDSFDHLAASDFLARLADVRHGFTVTEDFQGLFDRDEILIPDQYGGWPAVAGDHDALVLPLGSVDEIGQVVTHVAQRLHGHGHSATR